MRDNCEIRHSWHSLALTGHYCRHLPPSLKFKWALTKGNILILNADNTSLPSVLEKQMSKIQMEIQPIPLQMGTSVSELDSLCLKFYTFVSILEFLSPVNHFYGNAQGWCANFPISREKQYVLQSSSQINLFPDEKGRALPLMIVTILLDLGLLFSFSADVFVTFIKH